MSFSKQISLDEETDVLYFIENSEALLNSIANSIISGRRKQKRRRIRRILGGSSLWETPWGLIYRSSEVSLSSLPLSSASESEELESELSFCTASILIALSTSEV